LPTLKELIIETTKKSPVNEKIEDLSWSPTATMTEQLICGSSSG